MPWQSGDRQDGIGEFEEGRVSVGGAAAAARNSVPALAAKCMLASRLEIASEVSARK